MGYTHETVYDNKTLLTPTGNEQAGPMWVNMRRYRERSSLIFSKQLGNSIRFPRTRPAI
jgi:hypothetical protein